VLFRSVSGTNHNVYIPDASSVSIGLADNAAIAGKFEISSAGNTARTLHTTSSTGFSYDQWLYNASGICYMYALSPSYSTSGQYIANSFLIEASAAGGLGLSTNAANAPVKIYTNNTLRETIASDGTLTYAPFSTGILHSSSGGVLTSSALTAAEMNNVFNGPTNNYLQKYSSATGQLVNSIAFDDGSAMTIQAATNGLMILKNTTGAGNTDAGFYFSSRRPSGAIASYSSILSGFSETADDNNSYMGFDLRAGGASNKRVMTIRGIKVGIDTTIPDSTLHVNGSIHGTANLLVGNKAEAAILKGDSANVSGTVINKQGKFGVLTIAPDSTHTVTGSGHYTGNVLVGGNLTVNGTFSQILTGTAGAFAYYASANQIGYSSVFKYVGTNFEGVGGGTSLKIGGSVYDTGTVYANSFCGITTQIVTMTENQDLTPTSSIVQLNGTFTATLKDGSLPVGTVLYIARGNVGGTPIVSYAGKSYVITSTNGVSFVKTATLGWMCVGYSPTNTDIYGNLLLPSTQNIIMGNAWKMWLGANNEFVLEDSVCNSGCPQYFRFDSLGKFTTNILAAESLNVSGTTIQRNGFIGYGVKPGNPLEMKSTTESNYVANLYTSGVTASYGLLVSAGTASSNVALNIRNQNEHTLFRVLGNGSVYIDSLADGSLTVASGKITSSSDERFKNIKGMFKKGLKQILACTPKIWTYNKKSGTDTTVVHYSETAQDLMKAGLGEAVTTGKDSMHGVDDRTIIAALINGEKELDSTDRALISLLNKQQKQIDTLKTIIAKAGLK
jgi:hypothetical protein